LNVRGWPRDDDQPLTLTSCGGGATVDTCTGGPRLHDLDLAGAHMPDLVDFASAFPNDTANEVVRNKDLLRLKLVLLRRVVLRRWRRRVVHVGIGIPRNVGGRHPCGSTCIAGGPIGRVRKRRGALIGFDEDIPDVVCRNMDGICDPRDAQDPLPNREVSAKKKPKFERGNLCRARQHALTCIQPRTTRVLDFFDL
jgi:hypothetical protein